MTENNYSQDLRCGKVNLNPPVSQFILVRIAVISSCNGANNPDGEQGSLGTVKEKGAVLLYWYAGAIRGQLYMLKLICRLTPNHPHASIHSD